MHVGKIFKKKKKPPNQTLDFPLIPLNLLHPPVFFILITSNFIHAIPQIKNLEAILYLRPHSQTIGKPCWPFHQNRFLNFTSSHLTAAISLVVELVILLRELYLFALNHHKIPPSQTHTHTRARARTIITERVFSKLYSFSQLLNIT